MGNITFSHHLHVTDKGFNCEKCHPAPFTMKKGADAITMADINAGKSCGTCHDGKTAFAASECGRCHVK